MANTIAALIQRFSANHLRDTKGPYGTTPNSKLLTKEIPENVRVSLGLSETYKIYGSVGTGGWSEIPWFAILDKSITQSTQNGYYIVALFDAKIQNIYLGLAVGWTQFKNEYGGKRGKQMIRTTCAHYARLLRTRPKGFVEGTFNLGASGSLGPGYEIGYLFSKKYVISEISETIFRTDLEHLLESYLELKSIVGDSILNLAIDPSAEVADTDELQKFRKRIADESFSKDASESISKLINLANQAPPPIRERLKKEIVRNRKFAAVVKRRANYICEVDGRKPFVQENGRPYAEADHITPLGGGTKGLDSPDNMRCLCPQCHAIITYGSKEEIRRLLSGTAD